MLGLAIAIRVLHLIDYHALPDWSQLKMDHWYHHHWAESIAGGNILGDTTYFRAPFYAYCLGALYSLFGDSLWVSRLFGVAIGLVTILLVYLIARRLFGRTAGIVAALLEAIYPINIYYEAELLLDPLFTLLLLASLHRLLIWRTVPTRNNLLFTAILLGLAAITRPTALVPAALLVAWMLVMRTDLRTRLHNAAIVLGGLAIVIMPISVRNLVVAGDPVLIASQGGINLFLGNNDDADGVSAAMPEPYGNIWRIRDITYLAEKAEGRALKPSEISGYWQRQAQSWIFSHPVTAARLYAKKIWLSLGNREISNNRNIDAFFGGIPYLKYFPFGFAFLLGLAVIGVIIGWRLYPEIRIIAAVIATLLIVNAAFFVTSRFRLPIIPLLILLGSVAIIHLPALRQMPKRLAPALVIGLLACILSWLPIVRLTAGTNVQPLLSRALAAYADNDIAGSLAFAREALKFNDTFPEVNLTVGVCYLRMQRADSARYYFEREKSLHPDRPKAYANLGSLDVVNRRYAEARAELAIARALQPYDQTAGLLWIRAHARDTTLTNMRVIAAIDSVLTAIPNDPTVALEAASALVQRARVVEATNILRRGAAMQRPPIEMDDYAFERDFLNSPEQFDRRLSKLNSLLGYVYGVRGDYNGCVLACRTAIALDSANVDAYINLASGYWSQGDATRADSIVRAADTRFPDHPQLRNLLKRLHK